MNFLKRTLTGIVIVAVIVAGTLAGMFWSFLLFGLITVACTVEFIGIVNRGKGTSASAGMSAEIAFFCYTICLTASSGIRGGLGAYQFLPLALAVISVITMLLRELHRKKGSTILNLAVGMMPVAYIALPLSLIPTLGTWYGSLTGRDYNGLLPLMMFIFIWCNDVGAYCFGCTLGKHHPFPKISPKKSWEGSIGGAAVTIVAAVAIPLAMPQQFSVIGTWTWIAIAVFTVVFGTFGDLTESMMKREIGIKDSGNILPGHGGFLDRFDSTLLAVPAVAALLLILHCF